MIDPVATQDTGASVGGGETPGVPVSGPTPASPRVHATAALLALTIDCLTELIQTAEAKRQKSIHQRLVDGLKAVDRVVPWEGSDDAEVREAEGTLEAAADARPGV